MTLQENPIIASTLDSLERKFPGKALYTMEDCAELFGVTKENMKRFLKRRKIPTVGDAKMIRVEVMDIALYLARSKAERDGRLALWQAKYKDIDKEKPYTKQAYIRQILLQSAHP